MNTKKRILICLIFIVVFSFITVYIFKKEYNHTFIKDNVLFAIKLDGKPISYFPDYNSDDFTVDVYCENGKGVWKPVKKIVDNVITYQWKFVVEDIEGDVSCNLNYKTKTDSDNLKNIVEKNAELNVNGHRYNNKNSNNYIWFNDELWRIIGSVPVLVDSKSERVNLVKIIRNNLIGYLAYDAKETGYVSLWGNNTLSQLLNNHYFSSNYEALDGAAHAGCLVPSTSNNLNCNYQNIGILSTGYYGQMVESVYWNIDKTNLGVQVMVDDAYNNEIGSNTSSKMAIGLMSVSDYGYTTDYTTRKLQTLNLGASSSWMVLNTIEWVMGRKSGATAATISDAANIGGNYTKDILGVRPALYLDSSVYVVDGDGTISDPYILGM